MLKNRFSWPMKRMPVTDTNEMMLIKQAPLFSSSNQTCRGNFPVTSKWQPNKTRTDSVSIFILLALARYFVVHRHQKLGGNYGVLSVFAGFGLICCAFLSTYLLESISPRSLLSVHFMLRSCKQRTEHQNIRKRWGEREKAKERRGKNKKWGRRWVEYISELGSTWK